MSVGFLYCLKRERDISVKPILGGVKTAFSCTPALSSRSRSQILFYLFFCVAIGQEITDKTSYMTNYNPSINFRAILLATSRHVVQIHRTVITQ